MKQKLVKYLAVFAYCSGLCALFYWINRKAKRILTFHNVLPDEMFRDGVANGVSTRLSDFEKIIDECAKRFLFSTDLFDPGTLTATFDDGYRNQYTTAYKSLHDRGIPAYIFVAGKCLHGSNTKCGCSCLVIDKLTHWIDNVPVGVYQLGEANGSVEINDENRAEVWKNVIWPMFMKDGENMGLGVYETCDRVYPIEKVLDALPYEYRNERLQSVTMSECEEMMSAGWKVGWHTENHYPLSMMSADVVERELDSPAVFRGTCLSYPYGNPVEVGETAISVARRMGYPCAVSNTNESDWNTSPFFLPRMSLSSNKYRLHFRLSGMEYFIKHGRLLPKIVKGR